MLSEKLKDQNTGEMKPKNIVVTGGNNGIGYQIVKALYLQGHNVIFGSRNQQKNEEAVKEITSQKGGSLKCFPLDLSQRKSIDIFVGKIKQQFNYIDILVNNAGLMLGNQQKNSEQLGFQMTLVINHFGHFYYTYQLFDLVKKSTEGRIIQLSSVAHYQTSGQFLEDLECKNKQYGYFAQYAISKMYNVLFVVGIKQLLQKQSITHVKVASVHPGFVDTGFGSAAMKQNGCLRCLKAVFKCCMKNQQSGANSALSLCNRPFEEIRNGEYYDSNTNQKQMDKRARNVQNVEKLWKISEKAYGINFE